MGHSASSSVLPVLATGQMREMTVSRAFFICPTQADAQISLLGRFLAILFVRKPMCRMHLRPDLECANQPKIGVD